MAEQKEIGRRKVKVKNAGPGTGSRLIFDADGRQHLLRPGQQAEVEVLEPEAKRLETASQAGSDVRVEGFDPPEKDRRRDERPDQPQSRGALAEKEREELEAGAEADRERRERDAKKSGPELAAETGIHMHARGVSPEVKTAPPDAPPKKK